jgi:hypothetical protein
VRKLLALAVLGAAGLVVSRRRRRHDDEDVWTEATTAADLR